MDQLTPDEVANKRFTPVRLREGYDMGEVDDFLDRVEAALRSSVDPATAKKEAYAELHEEFQATLEERASKIADERVGAPAPVEATDDARVAELEAANAELRTELEAAHGKLAEVEAAHAEASLERDEAVSNAAAPEVAAADEGVEVFRVETMEEASSAAQRLLELSAISADQLVEDAKAKAEVAVNDAHAEAANLVADAETRLAELTAEAEARRAEVDNAGAERQAELDAKYEADKVALEDAIAKLRDHERELREHLEGYLAKTLEDVRAVQPFGEGSVVPESEQQ